MELTLDRPSETAATSSAAVASGRRVRLGIVGCGDVAHRHYLPPLAEMADRVEIVGCADRNAALAERARAAVAGWSADATAYGSVEELLAGSRPDAVVNLTPAPLHGAINQSCLAAGVHVYSEKPIASSVAEATRLIETATARGLLLLAAPAVAATRRFRWLSEIVASRQFGRLSLVVGHVADSGPATWREYTGDPEVFYGPGVGPVFDHGVYRLHGMTALMGPVRHVQAMGTIGVPSRVVRAGPRKGDRITVTAPDHVLINLEFANGGLGQLLASFGTASTLAPWLELHFESATISFPGSPYDKDATASLYRDDESSLGLEGWTHDLLPPPPQEARPIVETGIVHFIDCLDSSATPILTAEHARHVLDVILKAYESIGDGASHETETTFVPA